MKALDEI